MNIDKLWENIIKHQGKEFFTKTGKEFSYSMLSDNTISINHTPCFISKNYFETALKQMPIEKPFDIKGLRGYPYIFGILTDKRIM